MLSALLSQPLVTEAALNCPKSFRGWASAVFSGRDNAREVIAQLRTRKLKHFDFDRYFEAKAAFNAAEELPAIPSRKNFEEHLAWLESVESRALARATDTEFTQALPTLESVLQNGTARQRLALTQWVKNYGSSFEKGFERQQLARASADLSLILHNSRLDIGTLTRSGLNDISETFLKAKVQSKMFEKGLIDVFGEGNLIRKANLVDQVKNLLEVNAVKWPLSGAKNVGYSLSSKYLFNSILVSLPEHQIAKVSAEDMALILTEGWSKHGAEMTAKYAPKVKSQVVYNTFRNATHDLSYGSMVYVAYQYIKNHIEYEEKLDEQRHRRSPKQP